MADEDVRLLREHAPRMVVSFGCSASTQVLHLAGAVLTALGTPTGTMCDTPLGARHKDRCRLGTPSTDEIMRCVPRDLRPPTSERQQRDATRPVLLTPSVPCRHRRTMSTARPRAATRRRG
jgi:hypothetical protein